MHKQNFLTKLFRKYLKTATKTRCLKIKEKVSFNIASEASYVYKSSLKMPKLVLEKLKFAVKQCYQTRPKLVENAKMRHFE